jgi:hypothetical protein
MEILIQMHSFKFDFKMRKISISKIAIRYFKFFFSCLIYFVTKEILVLNFWNKTKNYRKKEKVIDIFI